MTTLVASNGAVSVFLAGGLSAVWGLINSLQIVAHFPLLNVQMPANATIMYDVIYTVATFDLPIVGQVTDWFASLLTQDGDEEDVDIFTEDALDVKLKKAPGGELDDITGRRLLVQASTTTKEYGYETSNPLKNSALAILLILVILLVVLIVTCLRCSLHKNKHVMTVTTAIKKKLFWTTFIRSTLENFIMLCIANLIKLYSLSWSSFMESATSIYALLIVIFLTACPFAARAFLNKKFDQGLIHDETFQQKYGEIIKNCHGRDKGSLLFNIFFMLRRIIMACLIVILPDLNWL